MIWRSNASETCNSHPNPSLTAALRWNIPLHFITMYVYRFVPCFVVLVSKVWIMPRDSFSLGNHIFMSSMASRSCPRKKSKILIRYHQGKHFSAAMLDSCRSETATWKVSSGYPTLPHPPTPLPASKSISTTVSRTAA